MDDWDCCYCVVEFEDKVYVKRIPEEVKHPSEVEGRWKCKVLHWMGTETECEELVSCL